MNWDVFSALHHAGTNASSFCILPVNVYACLCFNLLEYFTMSISNATSRSTNVLEGELVDQTVLTAQDLLANLGRDGELLSHAAMPFGDRPNQVALTSMVQAWAALDFSDLPAVALLSATDLHGARGAYAASTNTIYLSREFIHSSIDQPSQILDVVLEEIGHFIDSRINATDIPGDEGELFSALVQGKLLSHSQVATLHTEDDSAVLTLGGAAIAVELADGYTGTNLKSSLISSIGTLLDNIKNLINTEVLQGLPLLGNALGIANPLDQVFNDFKTQITTQLNAIPGNGSVAEVQTALFQVLGSSGLGILSDSDDAGADVTAQDIGITVAPDGSNAEFKLKIGKAVTSSVALDSTLGLPALGLSLVADSGITSNLTMALNLDFGVDATTGFFLDTAASAQDLDLALNTQFTNSSGDPLTFTGKLGFLTLTAKDQGSSLNGTFSVDLNGDLGSLTTTPQLTAATNLKVELSTGLGTAALPSIKTDFNLVWGFAPTDLKVGSNYQGGLPSVEFNNVRLNMGSFFKSFAQPIFGTIDDILGPIKPVIDVLQTKLPVLDTFGRAFLDKTGGFPSGPDGKVTFLDLVKIQQPSAPVDFIGAVGAIADLADSIDSFADAGDVPLAVGGFKLGGSDDIRNSLFQLDSVDLGSLSKTIKPLDTILTEVKNLAGSDPELQAQINTFLNGIQAPTGPQFPILTDPNEVFKLLLGQKAEFFQYTLPQLKFAFGFDVFFPILGPLGAELQGNLSAQLQLALGYDSTGITNFASSGDVGDIFADGFYIDNGADLNGPAGRKSGAVLTTGIKAYGAINVGVASAGVGGGVESNIEVRLNDPVPDDKVYFSEFDPDCIFNPVQGEVLAGLDAFIKFGIGPFSYTKRFDIAKTVLLSFEAGCDAEEQSDPVKHTLAVLIGTDLQLSMGSFAGTRRINFVPGTDVAEVFQVDLKSGTASNAELKVSAFGANLTYAGVSRIVANGGAENDTVLLGDAVLTPALLSGGDGNDQLYGSGGADTLQGDNGDDALNGGLGNDSLQGGAGIDLLQGGVGADTLDGGSGPDDANDIDTASYRSSPAAVTILPGAGGVLVGFGGDAQGDRLIEIEHIEGSNFDDLLTGDGGNNTLEGLAGSDRLNGGAGDDILLGGGGVDRLDGGDGQDWTSYLTSSGAVSVNLAIGKGSGGDATGETLISIENLQGSALNDTLVGSAANNSLDGFYGDDRLTGGAGADTLDGGAGTDWASYQFSPDAVNVSLKDGVGRGFGFFDVGGGDGKGDTLQNIENLEGSSFADRLEGSTIANILRGLGGNDTLLGSDGDDTLIGGAGSDTFDGGSGSDLADYSGSVLGVTVNLKTGVGAGGDAAGDAFVQSIAGSVATVENLLGSRQGDLLIGDDGNNVINPGLSTQETDTVFGGTGVDQLKVDYSGNDTGGMFGGVGFGYFVRDNAGGATGAIATYPVGHVFQDKVVFGSDIEDFYVRGTIHPDQVYGGGGNDTFLVGGGNDFVSAGLGNVLALGDDGIDTLSIDLSNRSDAIVLQSTDILTPNTGLNLSIGGVYIAQFEIFQDVKTGSGNDTLTQLDRVNNLFDTGQGSDIVNPGLGFDTVVGGNGAPVIGLLSTTSAASDNDDLLILDYSLKDTGSGMLMDGNPQNQTGSASRTVADGNSTLLDAISFSQFERLQVTGTSQGDRLVGGDGNDTLQGGAGDDTILANRGNDSLFGGDGNDSLTGTNGRYGSGEFISYPQDIDLFTGGSGADTFVLDNATVSYTHFGNADFGAILDFNAAEGDVIQLGGTKAGYALQLQTVVGVTYTAIYAVPPPVIIRSVGQSSTSLLAVSPLDVANNPGDLVGTVAGGAALSLDAPYFQFV